MARQVATFNSACYSSSCTGKYFSGSLNIWATLKLDKFTRVWNKRCSVERLIIDIKSNIYYFFVHRRLLQLCFGSSFEPQIEVPLKWLCHLSVALGKKEGRLYLLGLGYTVVMVVFHESSFHLE